jgi:hypothetical protein
VKRLSAGSDQFTRVDPDQITFVGKEAIAKSIREKIYLRQSPLLSRDHFSQRMHAFWIRRVPPGLEKGFEVWPTYRWEPMKRLIRIPRDRTTNGGLVGALTFTENSSPFTIVLGILDEQQRAACAIFVGGLRMGSFDITKVDTDWNFSAHVPLSADGIYEYELGHTWEVELRVRVAIRSIVANGLFVFAVDISGNLSVERRLHI